VKRSTSLGSGRRALRALLVATLGLGTVAAGITVAGALPPNGPSPSVAGVTITVSQATGLLNNQVITYRVNTPSAATGLFNVKAQICEDQGATAYNDATFSLASGTKCVNGANIYGGGLGSPAFPANGYEKASAFSGSETTSGDIAFKVGTGQVQWTNDNGNPNKGPDGILGNADDGLTCDVTHACMLAWRVDLNGATDHVYFSQQITFGGPPGAPTALTKVEGDHQVQVGWTAPSNTGNATIDSYTLTAQAPCSGSQTVAGTTATITGLTNFQPCTFDVTAHNTSGLTGPAASIVGTPQPGAPTGVSGGPAASSVLLSWNFTGSITNPALTQFRITPYDDFSGHVAQAPIFTGSTATSFTVTGLTNGHPYTFTVAGVYGASGTTADSSLSGAVTPTNVEVDQLITVTRPQGALVLTQACDTTNPTPYPVDANGVPNPVYPTSTPVASGACSVNLGTAKYVTGTGVPTQPTPAASGLPGYPSVGEGQFFKADGAINQVTLIDTRDSDIGWTVNGKLQTNFTDGSKQFSGHQLGWQPAVTDKTPDFTTPDGTYQNFALRGADALPANTAVGTGLGASRVLASAVASHGLGLAHLDAQLHILIPVFAKSGNYSALLQITAI
jgi:hypothetical protein